ncbi:MAG: acyl carrier protein [Bacteroidales bacterium]|nr:acyl carrier protein [Candidatus Minthousia equi]
MEIKEKVMQLVAECLEIPTEKISLETDMDDVEEWDSMRHVMILSRLEEEFDTMIPEDDIFDLVTIGAIVEEIKKIKG